MTILNNMVFVRTCRSPLTAVWISSSAVQSFSPKIVHTTAFATQGKIWNGSPFRRMTTTSGESPSDLAARDSSAPIDSTQRCHLRVALCQFHVTDDKELNIQTCASYLDRAAVKGAALVVLPEIWNSPYAVSAFGDFAETLPEPQATSCIHSPSAEMVRLKAIKHKMWIVGGSIPERVNDVLYNTCLVFDPSGAVVAKHRKVHLFDIDVPGKISFLESETLCEGSTVTTFDTPWCTIGVGICYDIRFPEYAMLLTQKLGCQILVFPGAFNMTTGPAHWELLQRARAVDNQCFVLTASPARTALEQDKCDDKHSKYPHYTAWGHSTAIAPWGDVIATTDEKAGIVVADLDLSKVTEMRRAIPTSIQKRTDLYRLVDRA